MIMLEPKTRVPKSNKKEDASKTIKEEVNNKEVNKTAEKLFSKL